jgi:hypothetical protein
MARPCQLVADQAWRINLTDYGPRDGAARHQVNTRLVEQHYDDLLRAAHSLLQRHTTASELVRALRSHTRHLASLARGLQRVGALRRRFISWTTGTISRSGGASSPTSTAVRAVTRATSSDCSGAIRVYAPLARNERRLCAPS